MTEKNKILERRKQNILLAEQCGLIYLGVDDEGRLDYMGTDKQRKVFEKRKKEFKDIEEMIYVSDLEYARRVCPISSPYPENVNQIPF